MGRVTSSSHGALDCRARVIAFPFAGGGETCYAPVTEILAKDISFVTISLAGRGRLQKVPPHDYWGELIDDLQAELAQFDDGKPLFFWGHSFGALLAYEIARRRAKSGLNPPVGIFLSAYPAPSALNPRRQLNGQTYNLPDSDFVEAIRQWGFFPDGVLDDEAVLRYVLPPLRADLHLDETYEYEHGPLLQTCGIVYGGMQDVSVSPDNLNAWRHHFATQQFCALEQFEGNHFYFHDPVSCDALCRSMTGHIDRLLTARSQSVIHVEPPADSALAHCIEQTPAWPLDFAVLSAITRQARQTPDALALKDGAREWTYASLLATAAQLGDSLSKDGIGRGDIVGVLLPHSAAYVIAILGAWSVGATVCLLEKAWPDSLVAEFTASCHVRRIMTTPALKQRLSGHLMAQMFTLVPESGFADWAPIEQHPDDIAFISLTSGSTGKPKAVQTTHAGTAYCFYAREALYPYGEYEREGINVFFAWECLRPLVFGHAAIMIPDEVIFDPPRLLALLQQERITRLVVTPSLLESVLDFPGLQRKLASQTAHMAVWFLMGEVVPARLVEKAAPVWPEGVRLVNAYSTWESLDIAYGDLLPLSTQNALATPIGHPLPGCTVAILNEAGHALPAGTEGELYVSAPGLSPGYLDDSTKTAERFVATPVELASLIGTRRLYRSGDCARMLPDGQLEILGRIDNTVKIRGFKVPLRSVESVLDSVAGISKSVVLPINDPGTGQPAALAAYVVGTDGIPSETTLARLRQQARAKLPEYAVPMHFIGLVEFPLRQGGSRKLDKSALPVPALTVPDRAAAPAQAPMTGLTRQVAALWCEVLGVSSVEQSANFFEQGGNSLAAARLTGLLGERLGLTLAVVDIYQHSTFDALLHRCQGTERAPVSLRTATHSPTEAHPVAIIGMAGRFPGATSVDAFWRNLVAGVDSLTLFERDTLLAKGVPAAQIDHPAWVPAGQVVADADKFDAPFFGIGQREATLMDPQHRLFMEVAWTALEESGYARSDNPYRQRTGVFASCGIDGYLVHHLRGGGLNTPLDPGRLMLTEIGNEKDYIATRVAYQLDLGGPAVSVGSACSSALAAVVQAAQAIATGQCEMAIAGASALSFPNFGICYEDGLVGSVDGRVRPFDAEASGTLFGDSVGAVVLKRMDLALADGDDILAVLTGASMSNDGRMKAGYTAPSAEAQKRCIVEAMRTAGLASDQLSYVECHATATLIGDAIELKGLSDAFDEMREPDAVVKPASCSIGSVKGNIGHANAAAGITGLIKTVLQLRHRRLAATANFDTLNPKLVPYVEHDMSPFVVQRGSTDWEVAAPARQLPRRAGVSSFGIGGTNAHVILEEGPSNPVRAPDRGVARPVHLITASARSHGSLVRHLADIADVLDGAAPADIAHTAYTLHVAREAHPLRIAVSVPADGKAAAARLRDCAAVLPAERTGTRAGATVAFCFSGQGSQHVGMARSLYRTAAEGGRFRKHFELACTALQRAATVDLAPLIMDGDEVTLHRPLVTQCGLFAVEYALAATLGEYGVRPVAVAGHSIGQYAASVIAGALTLDQASEVVAIRAMATEALRTFAGPTGVDVQGGMLAVSGDEATITGWLVGHAGITLAVRNAPGVLVLAGLAPALEEARDALALLGCQCRTVLVTHPFHTAYMQPVADALSAVAVTGQRPQIPMACNVSGGWLRDDLAARDYWARHMTSPVLWADNVAALMQWQPDVIVEIGPGAVLSRLVTKCLPSGAGGDVTPIVLSSLPPAGSDADDALHFSDMLGRLWASGVAIDWRAYHSGEIAPDGQALARCRVPTYPFETTSYWVRPEASIYATTPSPHLPQPAPAISSVWLNRLTPRSLAQAKLYCFPYAGGSSRSFEAWARMAPDWLDLMAIEWPGRNTRADEPLASGDDDDGVALDAIAAAIAADAGELPVIFCGMSYGATAAIDLLAGPLAEWAASGRVKGMVVVGRAPVTAPAETKVEPEQLLLVPLELRSNPVWQENFRPVLDADLAADERAASRILRRWRNADHKPLVAVPLQVHGGEEDPSFDWRSAHQWAQLTRTAEIQTYAYPGEHDFMMRFQARIFERIVRWTAPEYNVPAPDPAPLYAVQWRPLPVGAGRNPMPQARFIAGQQVSTAAWLAPRLRSDDACAALICERGTDDRHGVEQSVAFVELWQALMSRDCRGTLCLLLPSDAGSGPISGAAKVAATEYAPLRIQLAFADDHSDLTDRNPQDTWASRLNATAAAYESEPYVWQTRSRTFAPRLMPYTGTLLPQGSLAASGGNYLITGATGGLGTALIDWLIDDQFIPPERIVSVTRSAGATYRRVQSVCADLTDPGALRDALAPVPDIEGIFHLAGTLDDGMIDQMDAARMHRVLAPKLALESLLEHASRWRTQWAIAFSSTSSLLGVPGQANYAAANAWLDHLASWSPTSDQVPVLSIHWGTWGETGMSVRSGRALERAGKDGERSLRTQHALAALSCALAGLLGQSLPSRRLAVCDIDWRKSAWRDQPLVSGLLGHVAPATASSPGAVSSPPESGLHQAPEAQSDKLIGADAIRRFLEEYVSRWIEPLTLSEHGLDSLDLAQLRNGFFKHFGIQIPLSELSRTDLTLGRLAQRLRGFLKSDEPAVPA